MIVYVGAGSGPFRDLIIELGHGQMVSRQAGAFRVPKKGRWAFDNGAYVDFLHGLPFDTEEYLRRIEQLNALPDERLPDWCVTPDIVADRTSLTFSLRWRQTLARAADRRLRWYLAVQDFMTIEDVHYAMCLEPFDGLFIGGSTAWKKETAEKWVHWGHHVMGVPVHIARVNGPGPLQWAVDIDADSVDGTGWVRAGQMWVPWLKDIPTKQLRLFPFSPEMPSQWIRFGIYLEGIWGETDWQRWTKDPCPLFERPKEIEAWSPEEFVDRLHEEYIAPLPETGPDAWRRQFAEIYLQSALQGFTGRADVELWKRWVLWELERILKSPVPPEPPVPGIMP